MLFRERYLEESFLKNLDRALHQSEYRELTDQYNTHREIKIGSGLGLGAYVANQLEEGSNQPATAGAVSNFFDRILGNKKAAPTEQPPGSWNAFKKTEDGWEIHPETYLSPARSQPNYFDQFKEQPTASEPGPAILHPIHRRMFNKLMDTTQGKEDEKILSAMMGKPVMYPKGFTTPNKETEDLLYNNLVSKGKREIQQFNQSQSEISPKAVQFNLNKLNALIQDRDELHPVLQQKLNDSSATFGDVMDTAHQYDTDFI